MSSGRRRSGGWIACIGLLLALLALSAPAAGHDPFEVTSSGRIEGNALTLSVVMAWSSALTLIGADDQTPFSVERLQAEAARLRTAASSLYEVRSLGQPLLLLDAQVEPSADGDVEFRLTYPRPALGPFQLRASYLQRSSEGHGNAVTLIADGGVLALEYLHASDPVLDVQVPERPALAAASAPPATANATGFFRLGLRHIVTGHDHLLFLGGILLACRRVGAMLRLITCFSLAHSLTLAFAALGGVPQGVSAAVEPLIAASIVVVGIQNAVSTQAPKHRYLLTFVFGLVHGLGFASGLAEASLGHDGTPIVVPLLSFNIGVELGQMLVAAIALPLLLALRRSSHGPAATRAASFAMAGLGGYWLVERALFV